MSFNTIVAWVASHQPDIILGFVIGILTGVPISHFYYIKARTRVSLALHSLSDDSVFRVPNDPFLNINGKSDEIDVSDNLKRLDLVLINDGTSQINAPENQSPVTLKAPTGYHWLKAEAKESKGVGSQIKLESDEMRLSWELLRTGEAVRINALLDSKPGAALTPKIAAQNRATKFFPKISVSERIPIANRKPISKRFLRDIDDYSIAGYMGRMVFGMLILTFVLLAASTVVESVMENGKLYLVVTTNGQTDTLQFKFYKPWEGEIEQVGVERKGEDETFLIGKADYARARWVIIHSSTARVTQYAVAIALVAFILGGAYHVLVRIPREFGRAMRLKRALKSLDVGVST